MSGGLLQRRDSLAARLQRAEAAGNTQEARDVGQLLGRLDNLLGTPKAQSTATSKPRRRHPVPDAERILLAMPCPGGELRVRELVDRGTRYVDVRRWYVPKAGGELVPTLKGVRLTAEEVAALLNASF